MTPNCSQSLSNGQRCSAPAMHGSKYCRHHDHEHSPKPIQEKSPDSEPLALPPLTSKLSMLVAVDELVHALAEQRIKCSAADTLLSAIKLAHRILNELSDDERAAIARAEDKPYPQRPQPTSWQPTGQVAMDIAASSRPRKASPFSAPHRHPADFDMDASTASFVRELMAQSHQLAAKQAQGASK